MDNVTQEIIKVKNAQPKLAWDDIAKIVNYICNSNLTGNAVRKRYHKNKNDSATPQNPHYTSQKVYRSFVPLQLSGNSMFVSCTHAPFTISGAIAFLKNVVKTYKIDNVFHMGDIVDEYALSFYDKDPESDGIITEHSKAKTFIAEFANAFPKVYGTIGNHDNRLLRVAAKAGLPASYMKTFEEVFEMPDTWQWEHSYILNGDILLEHGTASGMRSTYDRALMVSKNVIQGHTHNYGGVLYINDGLTQRWALNVGCLADPNTYAMKYATDRKYQHTLGCGIIYNNVPMFIPYYE